jgi:DNA replication ATP-dependent helicase Dna2
MSKTAIKPGNQTRKKLKSFHFIEGRPASPESEKENAIVAEHKLPSQRMASQTPMKSSSQPEPIEKRLPPSTPAPRLPLADLIGNQEDRRRAITSNITPEEHVLWVHAQTPGSSQPAVTPARKRKRAKSSSPASSQQEQSTFLPVNGSIGALDAPDLAQADPAADLWQRYASGGTEASGADKSFAFAHLIRDSSPRSPATTGSVGGLRRWASCGVEWPQSATKRPRKTRRIEEVSREEDESVGTTKISRVGELLERMKETLSKPASQLPDSPSSSSPLPDRTVIPTAESSLHKLATVLEAEEHLPLQTKPANQAIEDLPVEKPQSPSSDYGDDDMDSDMLDAIESTARMAESAIPPPQELPKQPQPERPAPQSPPQQLSQCMTRPQFPQPASQTAKPASHTAKPPTKAQAPSAPQPEADEFGDDDDDDALFDVDVDQIAANYNTQMKAQQTQETRRSETARKDVSSKPSSQKQVQAAATNTKIPAEVISDDEYGDDDIDEDAFMAAEVMATQACQASGRATGCVGAPF